MSHHHDDLGSSYFSEKKKQKKNWYKNKTKHSVSFVVMYDRDIYSSM